MSGVTFSWIQKLKQRKNRHFFFEGLCATPLLLILGFIIGQRLLQASPSKIQTLKREEAGASFIYISLCIIPFVFLVGLAIGLYVFHSLGSKLRIFKRGEDGGVLIFVGLCLLPIMLMLGLAVDSAVGMEQKRKLQAAVDIAAKAGVANGNGDVATISAEARKVFSANTLNNPNISGLNISVNTANNTLTVSASINVTNTFMGFGGISSNTYNASATVPMAGLSIPEIAIVYEVSGRFLANNFHQNICNELINFVNNLPNNVMVSIIPIATEFLINPANTAANALFTHLDMTTNDEMASPAFFPLSPNYAWTSTNYNAVTNPYYTTGPYAVLPTDPVVLMSNPSPSICKLPSPNYPSCSAVTWPTKCPSTNNISCSQVYSYSSNAAYPILPLTMNKSLIVSYLNNLRDFSAPTDGFFPSLISWGWRTIDPNWSNFWMTNSSLSSTLRSAGQFPKPYGSTQKSMILIFNSDQYWNNYPSDVSSMYNNKCGNTQTVVNGLNHWLMTAYGMVPVPTDRQTTVNDITCENRWYKTMDKSLGLNLSDTTNYNATVDSATYVTDILNEVGAKFYRICDNIKAQNIDVYVLSNNNLSSLSACSNSSANGFTIANSSSSISSALNTVQTKIVTKASGGTPPPSGDGSTGSSTPPSGGATAGTSTPPSGGASGGRTSYPSGGATAGASTPPSGGATARASTPPSGGASGGRTSW